MMHASDKPNEYVLTTSDLRFLTTGELQQKVVVLRYDVHGNVRSRHEEWRPIPVVKEP